MGEVVVTALKRSTTVENTPLAITAITGDQLVAAGVVDITDVGRLAPGVTVVDAGPGSRRVVIRGVYGPGEPTVGTYYDETPVTGSSGTTGDPGSRTPELGLFDTQRIEVLRGPQGTLYGSGSMSGTFRVITNKPVFGEWGGELDATGDTVDHGGSGGEINGVLNVPLLDKLAARVVAFDRDTPGYITNVRTGADDLGDYHSYGGRLLVRYQPLENLTIDGTAYYQRSTGSQPYWFPRVGQYESSTYLAQPISDNVDLYSLTAHYDAGPVTVTAVSSYENRYQLTTNDLDGYYRGLISGPGATGTAATAAAKCQSLFNGGAACNPSQLTAYTNSVLSLLPTTATQPQSVHDWSNEIRMSSTGDTRFKWTVGFFADQRRTYTVSDQRTGDAATTQIIEPLEITSERTILAHLDQYAGFGEASFDVTHDFTLTFGIRGFDYDETNSGQTPVGLYLLGTKTVGPAVISSSESGVVYKFNASYKLAPHNLVYVEASEGFRPGGVNQILGLPAPFAPYKSDSLWNYELGNKSEWFGHMLYIDADIYDIEWSNMQVTGTTPNGAFSYIANAGAARIYGFEDELALRPIEGLEIEANGDLQNPRLTQNQVTTDVAAPGRFGNRIPYVAELQGDLSISYTHPIRDGMNGTVRADESYTGGSYSSFPPTDPARDKLPAYALTNFRLGVEAPDANWGAYFFIRNALDRTAIVWEATNATTGEVPEAASAAPRTFGINLRKKF
ncbi:MAG: TonB-dependent receptor [Caulobacteraceae bacterium]